MLWYAIAFTGVAPDTWGNTNRVVSNRVVSKGPLYPSKTETVMFLFFDTTSRDVYYFRDIIVYL